MRRVAVTGIGVLCPLGNDLAQVFTNARAGRSAVRRLDAPWAQELTSPLAASVRFQPEEYFEAPRLRMLDRVSQLAVVAARQAMTDARLHPTQVDRRRIGVFLGTGMGGSASTDEGYQALYADGSDRIKPFSILMGMHNAPAGWIGIDQEIGGPTLTYSTACASSAVSVGEAWKQVRNDELDVAIAGGAEAPLCFGAMKAWEALRTVANVDPYDVSTSCKPFARDRSGMVLAEGAVLMVLEDWEHAVQRSASIHGELIGYGLSNDCAHITRPTPAGQAAAMQAALDVAACAPTAIDAISAHGTGTVANDGVETAAIKRVFGEDAYRIPISATKAIHGHLLGAAGALELVLSLLELRHRVLFPTMHLQHPSEECDLDYVPNRARPHAALTTVMSKSFAFGGTNAVLIARAVH